MTSESTRILVVDDIRDWRTTVQGLLQDEGFEVEAAETSHGAYDLVERFHFDLAVLDIRLDETDEANVEGVELAKAIRINRPGVRIIMLTGYPSEATTTGTRKPSTIYGPIADAYIEKSKVSELLSVIRDLLAV